MVLWRRFAGIAQMRKVQFIVLVHICSRKELRLPFSFIFYLTHITEFHAQFEAKE